MSRQTVPLVDGFLPSQFINRIGRPPRRRHGRVSPGYRTPRDGGINLECVISQIVTLYYWASRENVQLVSIDTGGAFITFLAVNGAGYVRVVKPWLYGALGTIQSVPGRLPTDRAAAAHPARSRCAFPLVPLAP